MIKKILHWDALLRTFPFLHNVSGFIRDLKFLSPLRIDHAVEAEKEVGRSVENLKILWPAQKNISLEPTENERKFLKICKYFNDGFYSRPNIFVCEVPQAYCQIRTGLVCTPDFKAIIDSNMEYRRLLSNLHFRWFKPLRTKRLPGGNYHYATIFDAWMFNWHHWLGDCVPRLYSLSQAYPGQRIVLLAPSELKQDWKDSLAAALPPGFEILYLPGNSWVQVDRLLLPSFVSARANYHLPPGYYDQMRKTTFERLGLPTEAEPSERIYISRANATRRRILNEADLIQLLGRYGFRSVTPEKMAFKDQVDLFRRAEIVAGPHGANWGDSIYAGKTKNLVFYAQVQPETFVYTSSKALGQEHFFLTGGKDHVDADFTVDLAAAERVLRDEMDLKPSAATQLK
jgi:Glycosyltransferase 61